MQLEVQEFRENATVGKDGSIMSDGIARPAGPVKKYEFGAANDDITAAIGGAYISNWNSDYLQKALGKKGECHRFYHERKMAVDIRNPEGKTANLKRQLLYENGIGYLCIPEDFPEDVGKLQALYHREVKAYFAYEETHPRPVVLQETLSIDETGAVKKIKVTAIDIKVGGGVRGGSIAEALRNQEAEALAAVSLSSRETKELKRRTSTIKAVRKAQESGQPFRNPFVGKGGKRLYDVVYSGKEKAS